ncbi:MAG: gamma-glutamyl-gamma-aminobutyrate hydrolase family protein [Desulfobacterales bacterium]|nr:gamma-glutamyl-gamma-aminobutyrate hydrolase family protein [Desulfobacterales bacterium]
MVNSAIIGLSTYGIAHAEGYNIPGEYVQAVYRAGGVPLLLPPVGAQPVDRWLEILQGLVLTGGGDIDPASYNGPPHETVYNIDPTRDSCEFALARRALERRLPTLAICRGMQVVNVLLGGTLHPHLPEAFGEKVAHRKPPRLTTRHAVEVDKEAQIAAAMGSIRVDIVSWHHQAVDRLGAGLRPVAWSADRLIEAVELADHPNLLAVQWHPELSAADDPTQQALFDRLVVLATE